jgi:hypothetical protein
LRDAYASFVSGILMNIGPGKGHKETGKIDYTLLIWLFFIIISLQPVIRQETLALLGFPLER